MQREHYRDFSQALVHWFRENGKDYPWRRTTDPWAILVSEIMLQQTTIPTVLGRYEAWMQQFPTPAALAEADEATALRSWEGLGYYRRVRALKDAASIITEQYGGVFPTEKSAIRALPGIGDYTVGAVLSFAYNRPAPLVDANVSRVFARVFNDSTPVDSPAGRKKHWLLAAELVDRENPRAYNSALMELGQSICTADKPTCLICPVRDLCTAVTPSELPIKLPKKEICHIEHHDLWCVTEQGLLMEKQPNGKRHEGLYRLPQRPQNEVDKKALLSTQKYSVTRYKVTRYLYAAPSALPKGTEEFIPFSQLPHTPMASPDRKIINQMLCKA